MRMMFPGVRERRTIDRLLSSFFREYQLGEFRRAICAMSRFYNLPTPTVHWFEYLDWGKSGGRTYENGKIHLVHPENWKKGRKYNSERRWVHTVFHEMGHYVLWADAERKADHFAYRFIRGVAASGRNGTGKTGTLASRAARKRRATRLRLRRRPRRSRSR